MINILYLHGLESKLSLAKRKVLEQFGSVFAPNLDYFNEENTIALLFQEYKNQKIDVIIGSSIGGFAGFYLAQLLQKPAFLFNPALKERSVPQIIPSEVNFLSTELTLLLGKKDDVVPNEKTLNFLSDYQTESKIEMLFDENLAHGIPLNIFESRLKTYLNSIKNV